MDPLVDTTLSQIYDHLDKDMVRFGQFNLKNEGRAYRNEYTNYVKYLVSVASHPIGLRASVSPFNSSQEHMLAYIKDIFSIDKNKFLKIITGGSEDRKKVDVADSRHVVRADPVKRHPWRPELRMRILPPTFFHHGSEHIERLRVRVYLFRDLKTDHIIDDGDDRKSSILDKILKKYRIKHSFLIRPVDQMRYLVKFRLKGGHETNSSSRLSKYLCRMVQSTRDGAEVENDLFMNIRRYYCESRPCYILRFEFWFEPLSSGFNLYQSFRNLLRRVVFNGPSNRGRSTYMNEKQVFYGQINIKLSEIPSYASRQTYPVLSLNGSKINNCDMCLEFRNRRIGQVDGPEREVNANDSNSFVINHVRLYANCLLYHCFSVRASLNNSLTHDLDMFQSVTLDDLFYVPAFSLINQHRLQSNLSRIEDSCLRRVTILTLLMKLDRTLDAVKPAIIVLDSVLQNEYQTSDRYIDEKTKQEIDPFRQDTDTDSNYLFRLEKAILESFIENNLNSGLKDWPRLCARSKKDFNILSSLIDLRLVRTALSYFKKSARGFATKTGASFGSNLKRRVQEILCDLVVHHLKDSFDNITQLYRTAGGYPASDVQSEIEKSWFNLHRDIKCIDHDIRTYWSRKGLDELILENPNLIKSLNPFEILAEPNLKKTIRSKINEYTRT